MKRFNILVVDDDKDFRDLMIDYLEADGFITRPAENVDIAFKHIRHEKPDLILLDIEMPTGNGMDFCRVLHAQPSTMDIPVVFVSGSISLSNMRAGYLAGARQFLSKPFELDKLGECVAKILHQNNIGISRIPRVPCRTSA